MKEEPKKKLSFFKKAKQEPDTSEEANPASKDADQAEDVEASPAQSQDSGQDAVKDEAEKKEASASREQPSKEPKPVRKPLLPVFLPHLSLAIRALVILAIVAADAYAAYFLVVKVISPNLAMAKVAQVRESLKPSEKEFEPIEVEIPETQEVPEVHQMGNINLVEDLVVNPSGSQGMRYLCTTVAFESLLPEVSGELTQREAQVRDVLIEILGKRTVEELATLETRDQIRNEIKMAVNELVSTGEVVGVYFSNFVLQ